MAHSKYRKDTIMNSSHRNIDTEFKSQKIAAEIKTAAEMGSRPVQETDTGPGGMTATGPKRRLGRAVGKNQKKYGTRVGTGSVSARKPSGRK